MANVDKEIFDVNYEYDCPHFVDFNNEINDLPESSPDDYFATDHENELNSLAVIKIETTNTVKVDQKAANACQNYDSPKLKNHNACYTSMVKNIDALEAPVESIDSEHLVNTIAEYVYQEVKQPILGQTTCEMKNITNVCVETNNEYENINKNSDVSSENDQTNNTKIETNVHNRPSNVVKCREDWEKIKRRSGTNKARNISVSPQLPEKRRRVASQSPINLSQRLSGKAEKSLVSCERNAEHQLCKQECITVDESNKSTINKIPFIKPRLTMPRTPSFMKRGRNRRVIPVNMASKGSTKADVFPSAVFFSNSDQKSNVCNEQETQSFKPIAQQILEFTNKTPKRFHKKGHKQSPFTVKIVSPQLTKPVSPNFATKTRIRPVIAKSREQVEEEEIAALKQHAFKAQPVNRKVLEEPEIVHPLKHKPIHVEEFHLETEARAIKHRDTSKSGEENNVFHFHAQPVPYDILSKPVSLPEVSKPPLTVPESPALKLKQRKRTRSSLAHVDQQTEVVKRRSKLSVPHVGLPFQPKKESRIVEPEPFSFEERDKARLAAKEARIEQEKAAERKLAEFKAQPMPEPVRDPLPPKISRSPTKVQPFHFFTDQRIKVSKEHEESVTYQFHAKPPTVLEKEPFVPEKHQPTIIDVKPFHLATDERAERWAQLERERAERELETDAIKEARRREIEEKAKEEEEKLRQQTVHKANPVRHYKNIVIAPSDKPLTEAQSPHFSTRFTR